MTLDGLREREKKGADLLVQAPHKERLGGLDAVRRRERDDLVEKDGL